MVIGVGDFAGFKLRVSSILGFSCSDYSDSFLTRRFDVRLRATNTSSYESYLSLLEKSTDEQKALKKELTIHVTNFFRDHEFWEYFESSVIPALIRDKESSGQKLIRIWSAGCSTGEEPLSIAICLGESLKDKLSSYTIRIIATDYDHATIEFAKSGGYAEPQFREMPRSRMLEYFTKGDSGTYLPKDSLRSMVEYRVGDILKDPFPKNIDIIFCRNTVIYFNAQAKSDLYVKFHGALADTGYLILGKTECLAGPAHGMFSIVDSRERVYKK